ncbi:MAG TPA: fluoride efflux transporter CrcB [Novosphingobium sp.]|nr:fluoride efflux transporter CrcB [Novosphingobium sp.]HQA18567.1 fluoride efflux transporter CrcB [Novosphingobium sp.]
MNSGNFLSHSALVALGGGLGAWLRYLVAQAWLRAIGPVAASAFPWATLSVNVIGSAAMGLLAGWLARHGQGGEEARLLLGVGVLGGFTTFSAFSLELVNLAERGELGGAALYAALSLGGGAIGLIAGLALARSLA